MSDSRETRNLPDGARVVLAGREGHPQNGKQGAVIGALPNPSGRLEKQWYDVRFDDNTLGRFAGRYLAAVNTHTTQTAGAPSAA